MTGLSQLRSLKLLAALFFVVAVATGGAHRAQAVDFSASPISFPKPNGEVDAMAVAGDGTIYIGGAFTSVDGTPRNHLAAIAPNGTLTSWNPNVNALVSTIAISGSTIYVGGDFTSISTTVRNHLAAIDTAGSLTSWNPNVDDTVSVILLNGSNIYIGGDFTNVGGLSKNFVAALNAGTGTATSWNPNPNDSVFALAIDGNIIYLGGNFTAVGGANRNRLAAVDTSGTATAWNPNASSFVTSLQIFGGVIYAGGNFTSIGSSPRNHVAALDSQGVLTSWTPEANNLVATMQISGSTIYLGGDFTTVGGTARNHVAAVTTAGTLTSWNPNADDSVSLLLGTNSTLYVGGLFHNIAGQALSGLAVFAASGSSGGTPPPSPPPPSPTPPPPSGSAVATPVFSPAGGTSFSDLGFISITDSTPAATIRYSIDGTDPSSSSPTFLGVIVLTNSATVKARASASGLTDSPVASATYTNTGTGGGGGGSGSGDLPPGTSAGDLVKFAGDGIIYLVQNDGLHAFDTYDSYLGYVSAFHKSLIAISDGSSASDFTIGSGFARQVVNIPPASSRKYVTDTLVNQAGTIYLIIGGTAIPFSNLAAFQGLGYQLKYVVKGNISGYSVAQNYHIDSPSQAHPWGSWLKVDVSHFYYMHQTGLLRSPSSNTFSTNGGQAKFILGANQADLDILDAYPDLQMLVAHDSRVY